MEIIAIITANILFLALMAFAVRLDRRIGRVEERSHQEVGRLTERVFHVNRAVRSLSDAVEALRPAASPPDERERDAGRLFAEALEELMSYSAPKGSESEASK